MLLNRVASVVDNGTEPDKHRNSTDPVVPARPLFIALARRGKCPFLDKFMAMQVSGFDALIVGDDRREGLVTMYAEGDTEGVFVPGVFVGFSSWNELRGLAMGEDIPGAPLGDGPIRRLEKRADISRPTITTKDEAPTKPTPRAVKVTLLPNPSPFELLPLLLVSVSLPLLTLAALIFLGRYRVRRRRWKGVSKLPIVKYKRKGAARPETPAATATTEDSPEEPSESEPLLAAASENVEVAVHDEDSDEDLCAICLDEFKEGEQVRMLRCGHGYHPNCVGGYFNVVGPNGCSESWRDSN